jgi:hypothetical protein
MVGQNNNNYKMSFSMTSILVGISCSTFNNISIISLLSDMTVEEMETTDENHR